MLKPSYEIEGERWMPIARAAALLGTSPAGIKKLMGDGTLEYTQVPRGTTLLVEEAGLTKLRLERKSEIVAAAKRASASLRTAHQNRKSQLDVPPVSRSRDTTLYGVFDPSWDSTPVKRPPLDKA